MPEAIVAKRDATSPYATTTQLVAALVAREVSARELCAAAIARILERDVILNAVVARDFERAQSAAAAADAALARGERRPLLGIPMTVKESFNVAGLPTTWGIPDFARWVADTDAVAVSRLKAAGAVILGKTNVPLALGEWQAFNAVYGSTSNPWALDRTPGGSSGGSAVSLAAGYVSLEIGSDIAGSLRSPAHYCGVFSHKPSHGLVPTDGHAMPGTLMEKPDLAVAGPLARSAADLTLALDILAGPNDADRTAYSLKLPPARHAALRDYRVLVLYSHPLLPAELRVRTAIDRLANQLRAAGTTVAESSPLLPDLAEAARTYLRLLYQSVYAGQSLELTQAVAAAGPILPAEVDELSALRARTAVCSHRDWLAADEARHVLAHRWQELFREWDVVLFPPMPTVAFLRDEVTPLHLRTIESDGTLYTFLNQQVYASLATGPGLPATTVPLERPDGLPVGVQIIGPLLEDRTTLRFAELIEELTGGFVPPPGFE